MKHYTIILNIFQYKIKRFSTKGRKATKIIHYSSAERLHSSLFIKGPPPRGREGADAKRRGCGWARIARGSRLHSVQTIVRSPHHLRSKHHPPSYPQKPLLRCPIKSSGLRISSILSTAALAALSLYLPQAALGLATKFELVKPVQTNKSKKDTTQTGSVFFGAASQI